MPDIFDQLSPDKPVPAKGDIFDQVASGSTVEANPAPSFMGVPMWRSNEGQPAALTDMINLPRSLGQGVAGFMNIPAGVQDIVNPNVNHPKVGADTPLMPSWATKNPLVDLIRYGMKGLGIPGADALGQVQDSVSGTVQGLTTPTMVGMGPLAAEAGPLGMATRAGFGADMAQKLPAAVGQVHDVKSGTDAITQALMVLLPVLHAVTGGEQTGMNNWEKMKVAKETPGPTVKDIDEMQGVIPPERRLPQQAERMFQATPKGTVADVREFSPGETREFQRSAQAEADPRAAVNTTAAGLENQGKTLNPRVAFMGTGWTKQGDVWVPDKVVPGFEKTSVGKGRDVAEDEVYGKLEALNRDKQTQQKGKSQTQETIEGVTGIDRKQTKVADQGKGLVFREWWEKQKTKGLVDPYPEKGGQNVMSKGEEQALPKLKQYIAKQTDKAELERLSASLGDGRNRFQREVKDFIDNKVKGQPGVEGENPGPMRSRYDDLSRQFKDVMTRARTQQGDEMLETLKELQPIQKEIEEIKNKNKGMPPGVDMSNEELPEGTHMTDEGVVAPNEINIGKGGNADDIEQQRGHAGGRLLDFRETNAHAELKDKIRKAFGDKGQSHKAKAFIKSLGLDASIHIDMIKSMAKAPVKEQITNLGLKEGMNSHELMGKIKDNPEYFGQKESALAGFLQDKFGKILEKSAVDFGEHPDIPGRGAYDYAEHRVYLNVAKGRDLVSRALHESAHAATSWQYAYPKTATQFAAADLMDDLVKKSTEALPDKVKEYFKEVYNPHVQEVFRGKKGYDQLAMMDEANKRDVDMQEWNEHFYALTNTREFIAQAFSIPKFREWLDSIPAGSKSLLGRFTDSVKDLLGIKRDSVLDNMMDNLMAVSEEGEWGNRESRGMKGIQDLKSPMPDIEGGNPHVERAWDEVKKEAKGFSSWWKQRDMKGSEIPAMVSRADNKGRIMARQVANDVRDRLGAALGSKADKLEPVAKQALSFVIEAQGDAKKLLDMQTKINTQGAWWARDAKRAIGYAIKYNDKMKDVAAFVERVNKQQVGNENKMGIQTQFREGYIPHVQDLSDVDSMLFEGGKRGVSGSYTHERVHDTLADSIKAGVKPVSLDAMDLIEHRMSAGLRRINRAEMTRSLGFVNDPASGKAIIKPTTVKKKASGGWDVTVPPGYEKLFIGDDVVAVHKAYAGLLKNLTGESAFAGGPLGRGTMAAVHTMKHTALLFDLYHPVRLWAYAAPLRATLDNPLEFVKGTKEGLAVLDYNEPTLQRMAARGDIDPALLPELKRKRGIAATAIKTGYNVGRISDNLYSTLTQAIPGVGKYNKWLFDKFQRGLMMETYAIEFDRRKGMEPALSDEQIGRKVSKDLNTRFGNLGNESWVKSQTMQDLLRLFFLAPQWNEGLIRSELGSLKQVGESAAIATKQRRIVTGALMRDSGLMMAGLFLGNQIINQVTRGKPTWENEENQPGAKISAWIPDTKKLGGQGKSDGYFLNPFSLSAEITHSIINRAEKDKSVIGAVDDVLNNKLSAIGRIVDVIRTREDWQKHHLDDWGVVKEVAKQAAVMPIQAPAIAGAITGKEQFPGSQQRSLMASVGLKTDQVQLSPGEKIGREAGKDYATMGLQERAQAAKKLPKPDYQGNKEAGAERAIQREFELAEEVHKKLPPALSTWLDSNKLDIHGYRESLSQAHVRLPLTDEEKIREQTLVTKEFSSRLAILKKEVEGSGQTWDKERLQKRVNIVLAAGRKRAMMELKQSINSGATPTGQP